MTIDFYLEVFRSKAQLAKLLKSQKKAITVKFASTNKQTGADDCRAFAAAYST